jgi:uncharacterized membrane protein YbhN (UPF0104 family)
LFSRLICFRPLRWAVQVAPVAVFGLLVLLSDWDRLLGMLSSSRAGLLILAILAALTSTAAQAASWRRLLLAQGWDVPAGRCWIAHLAGLFLGRLTPNHLGEWAKVAYVLEGTTGRGLATVAGEKILRAGLLLASGPLAAFWLAESGWLHALMQALQWPGPLGWSLLSAGVALLAGLAVALKKRWVRGPGIDRLAALLADFLQGLAALRSRETASALGWSAVALAAFGLQVLLVARALAIELPAPTLLACHMLALAVFTLVPVSAGGFGTEEVVILSLFTRLGVSLPAATAYAMVNIALLSLFLPALGALVWLFQPIPLSTASPVHDPERQQSLRQAPAA